MTSQIARPYFKDFTDMKHSKGKTFIAPERILKSEHALYFPNLRGRTLNGVNKDTTDVLQGKVSVVSVFSSGWAENQVRTFCSKKDNPELHTLLSGKNNQEKGPMSEVQLVEINHEPNTLKYWILRLFAYRLRAQRSKEQWSNYFLVRRGFVEDVRESLAIMNQRVGYVYLLDARSRVRWAGSARADAKEKESLVKGLRRLIQEANAPKVAKTSALKSTDSAVEPPVAEEVASKAQGAAAV